MITKPDQQIRQEIEEQRPPYPAGVLSHQERERLIERGTVGLYRWYIARSQETRNWNPDKSFAWNQARRDHSPEVNRVLEGFYAVEQYVPDYTSAILNMMRRSYGRSHFTLRWGAEEAKHSDTWRNALIFIAGRSPEWVENYGNELRDETWRYHFDDPLHMNAYVVIQERATQVNYLNMLSVAAGKNPNYPNEEDPVLAQVSKIIAVDEAAHYNFFFEIFRLHLYYFPDRALQALYDVLQTFTMPADKFMPDFQSFAEALMRTSIYGPREYARDVLQHAFNLLTIRDRRTLEKGIKATRDVPDPYGRMVNSAFWDGFSYMEIEKGVQKLFKKVQDYEAEVGFDTVDPTVFKPSGLGAAGPV